MNKVDDTDPNMDYLEDTYPMADEDLRELPDLREWDIEEIENIVYNTVSNMIIDLFINVIVFMAVMLLTFYTCMKLTEN